MFSNHSKSKNRISTGISKNNEIMIKKEKLMLTKKQSKEESSSSPPINNQRKSSSSSCNHHNHNKVTKASSSNWKLDKMSERYRELRDRNNEAVKKSRAKKTITHQATLKSIEILKHKYIKLKSKKEVLSVQLEKFKNSSFIK